MGESCDGSDDECAHGSSPELATTDPPCESGSNAVVRGEHESTASAAAKPDVSPHPQNLQLRRVRTRRCRGDEAATPTSQCRELVQDAAEAG